MAGDVMTTLQHAQSLIILAAALLLVVGVGMVMIGLVMR
jgi:hypothetical protein